MPPERTGVIDPPADVSMGVAATSERVPLFASASSLRRHVNLTRELAYTQFKLKYTGSALGYMWSLLKPAMFFAIMYVIFVYLFHADRASPDFSMQLLLGVVIWNLFAESTGAAIGSIVGGGGLIRKAFFPRVILVVAATLTAMLTFLINVCLVLIIGLAIGHIHLGLRSLVAPLLIVELYALILGASLLLSALFVFYRDVGHIWEVLTQIIFYGSAVVFPFAVLPGRFLPRLVACNPVAQIIEDARHAVVTSDRAVPWVVDILGLAYVVPLVVTASVLGVGALVFTKLEPRFAEEL